jgi:DNA-directed RNA polymerase subunit F
MNMLSKKPLSMAETSTQIKGLSENKALEEYFKKFTKLSRDKAKSLAEQIRSLNNPKIKEEHVVKVVDFVPKDAEEVNKLFTDVSMSEDETNKILSITKEY